MRPYGIDAWLERHSDDVIDQARRRRHLPPHHSTGAIEEVLAAVQEFMAPRAFCYRNGERSSGLGRLPSRSSSRPASGQCTESLRNHTGPGSVVGR